MDSCPSGSILNLRFPKCYQQNIGNITYGNYKRRKLSIRLHFIRRCRDVLFVYLIKFVTDFNFECLGHWDGPQDQKYLILLDGRHHKQNVPKYRCGVSFLFLFQSSCL